MNKYLFELKNCYGAPQAPSNDVIETPVEDSEAEALNSLRNSFSKLQSSLQPDLNELILRIGSKFEQLKEPALKLWKYVETQIAPLLGSFYQLISKVQDVGLKKEFEDLFLLAHKQFSSLITEVEKLPKSNFSDVVHAFTTVPVMLTMLANWREFPAKIMSSILKYLFEHMEVQH